MQGEAARSGVSARGASRNGKLFLVALALLTAFFISMSVGRYPISPLNIFKLVLAKLGFGVDLGLNASAMKTVFWSIRLPRTILAIGVGAALGSSGTVFQGLFRNPLVSPDILGVSSGAGFGAALAIMFLGGGVLAVQSMAFLFGMVGVFIAYSIAEKSKESTIVVLVLAGIVVSAVFTAGLSFLKYIADPYEELPSIVFWTMGSFHAASWRDVAYSLPIVTVGIGLLSALGWRLNVMTMGDEEALSLGVNVTKTRLFFIVVSTLIVASSISACGTIAWVGLVIPHIGRYLAGSDHKILVPFCAFLGGTLLLLMDTLARMISTAEIPISIITSFIGAPFLAYLLLRKKAGVWYAA
ncbi:MAG: iron ABC transporter permease [Actinomycetota bacterium]|nr:iron ABC transporter permease [Actinomycetota bacterium]